MVSFVIEVAGPQNSGTPSAVECDLRLPLTLTATGAARYPVYSIRLGDILKGLMDLGKKHTTPQNFQIIHSASVQVWHEVISSMTLPETMAALSGQAPCQSARLLSLLPRVAGELCPGNYLQFVLPDVKKRDQAVWTNLDDITIRLAAAILKLSRAQKLSKDEMDAVKGILDTNEFLYNGSASSVSRGISGRCQQHLSTAHRAKEWVLGPPVLSSRTLTSRQT